MSDQQQAIIVEDARHAFAEVVAEMVHRLRTVASELERAERTVAIDRPLRTPTAVANEALRQSLWLLPNMRLDLLMERAQQYEAVLRAAQQEGRNG